MRKRNILQYFTVSFDIVLAKTEKRQRKDVFLQTIFKRMLSKGSPCSLNPPLHQNKTTFPSPIHIHVIIKISTTKNKKYKQYFALFAFIAFLVV